MTRVVIVAVAALLLAAQPAEAKVGKDGPGEVRAVGVCGTGARAKLRLKTEDDGIEVRFEVDHARGGVSWRVALVHERRVVWKGSPRTGLRSRSFELKRTLPDLPGTDVVTVRAWGPRGLTCRATAALVEI